MTSAAPFVKCVVWDLDHTLWDGVLLEDAGVRVKDTTAGVMRALDARGVLNSVASRNDHARAMAVLDELGLAKLIVCPEINWGSKADSIQRVARRLGIALDACAFVDDEPFERAEVSTLLPDVRVFDASEVRGLLDRPDMNPVVTPESARRREMYQADARRDQAEQACEGDRDAFLASLDMRMTVGRCQPEELARVEELIVRTHQLNSSGYTYDRDELVRLCGASDHLVAVAGLTDRFGDYGRIGVAVVETGDVWTIRLLLVSCRVLSRGAAAGLLIALVGEARARGAAVRAELVANDVNRPMQILLRFAGFRAIDRRDRWSLLELAAGAPAAFPAHLHVDVNLTSS